MVNNEVTLQNGLVGKSWISGAEKTVMSNDLAAGTLMGGTGISVIDGLRGSEAIGTQIIESNEGTANGSAGHGTVASLMLLRITDGTGSEKSLFIGGRLRRGHGDLSIRSLHWNERLGLVGIRGSSRNSRGLGKQINHSLRVLDELIERRVGQLGLDQDLR